MLDFPFQNLIVSPEITLSKYLAKSSGVLDPHRVLRNHHSVQTAAQFGFPRPKVLAEEEEQQMKPFFRKGRVDGRLAEEILHAALIEQDETAQSVKQVVEGIQTLHSMLGTLVFRTDERPAQFDGLEKLLSQIVARKAEQMGRRHDGLPETVVHYFIAQYIAVAADDAFRFRIPKDQLLVLESRVQVEGVQVGRLAGAAATRAECDFAQTADFLKHMGRSLVVYDIEFVICMVGISEKAFFIQLSFQQFLVDRGDDFFLFHLVLISLIHTLFP